MIKIIKDTPSLKSGEIVTFSKRKEQELVDKGVAMFVKIEDPCYKFK